MHVHHPPQKTGDSYHLVALTSSTLGSLKLDPLIQNHVVEIKDATIDAPLDQDQNQSQSVVEDKPSIVKGETDKKISAKEEFAMGMIEAKTWSTMIDGKIPKIPPKTPLTTPPGEPEMIDAWEMMEGLEDFSPLRPAHFRSFSFHVASNHGFSSIDDQPTPRVKENCDGDGDGDGTSSPKPGWLDSGDTDTSSNSNDTSIVSEFDPEVIATFRRALEDLPPANPFHLKTIDGDEKQSKIGKDKLIVYFTSLRGVRKTYEECCHVRVILKGLGVKVDERDVSMHSRFKEELKELLAEGSGGIGLPSVFLGGKCVGGAEEIRRLNEEGMLEKLVENCEMVDDRGGGGGGGGGGGSGGVCEACGDVRFVPCETCSGSCKIFYEDEDEIEEDECEENEQECGFQRCPDCNENGLIRCPICCDD